MTVPSSNPSRRPMTGSPFGGHPRAPGRRALAALVVLLVTAACGQKAGVGDPEQAVGPDSGAPQATVTTVGGGEQGVPTEAAVPSDTATSTTSPLRTGSAAAGAPRSGTAATGPAQPSAAAGGGAARATTTSGPAARAERAAAAQPPPAAGQSADPRDREGVTDKEIVIGMHAPITGAAPVPPDCVDKAMDLYFSFLAERGWLLGR